MRTRYAMRRSGTFSIFPHQEDHACGPRHLFVDERRNFAYEVVMECPAEALDENGFVLDNFEVQRYFDEVGARTTVLESCETIAHRAVHELLERAGRRPDCIAVTITGTPGAALTASWKRSRRTTRRAVAA